MTEPVITNGKIVGVNDTVTMSDAPEMLDARLYVFEGQNFVSEKDYRAKQAQVERLILERDAALAGKSLTAISETPDSALIDSPKAEGEETK